MGTISVNQITAPGNYLHRMDKPFHMYEAEYSSLLSGTAGIACF
jgi:hypothetical protein